jgi:transcriptional regulator with XRE-family HTH domain
MLRNLGNLKGIRSERSLTVEQLSKGSGVPRSTIIGLEGGVRSAQPVTIDKLAKASYSFSRGPCNTCKISRAAYTKLRPRPVISPRRPG